VCGNVFAVAALADPRQHVASGEISPDVVAACPEFGSNIAIDK
jgi:hypothetical protein